MSNIQLLESPKESSNLSVEESGSSQRSNPIYKSRIWKRTEKKIHNKTTHKARSHIHDTSSVSNDSSLDRISLSSHPARLYSDVVAFGNEAPTSVSHIATPPRKKMSKKKNPHKQLVNKRNSFEGFPPLTKYVCITKTAFSDDDYVSVDFEKSIDSTQDKGVEDSEAGTSNQRDDINKLDLQKLLNFKVDDFNFTEIDDDPNSTSFPRFLRVFEDDDYLKLEQKILQNLKFEK